MADILYPELSYTIVGICIDVYKNVGGGYQEKYYQRALEHAFQKQGILYTAQEKTELVYRDKSIGRYFIDFVIEKKIVLEIKSNPIIYQRDIKQVLSYLHKTNLDLGIIALFTKYKVSFKRILKGK